MDPSSTKASHVRLRSERLMASAGSAGLGVAARDELGSRCPAVKHPGRAVMVVDDDHDLRTTIQSELEERGYVVYGAANGMEAINILRQVPPPRLILLDLMMPIMNGWDFLQTVKDDASLSQIPVTVLTWLQHTTIPDSPVLTKPLDLRTLIEIVEQHAAA